jgi:3-dehydroquinate synthase/shikimate kinase/3-dehydroquinate synthase
MKPIKLIIKTNTEKYPIIIGSNLISKAAFLIKDNLIQFKKCLLILDKNVPTQMVSKLKKSFANKNTSIYLLKANEKNKNQKTINNILEILLKKNFSRNDCLIAIGGGITGDIGSFAASIFKRGMQFINIPTTLLSQVDSSVGGKTGINTKYGKNLVGSFYQPKLVISDSLFLKSLPKREIICGYGEILKHSLIANKKFYNFLNKNFLNILNLRSPFIEKSIFESCKIKKKVVEKDEKEKNLRKILNFGHTFAHSYEATLNYSKKLNHGEAVLLGINTALEFSFKNKLLRSRDYYLIKDHIQKSNLPNNLKDYFSSKHLNQILSFMLKDKKNNSEKINLVLLKKIGYPIINKYFSKDELKRFLAKELLN